MPLNAVEHCLIEARLSFEEIDAIAYSGHINEQRLKTMFAIDDQLLERITGLDYKQKFLLRTKDLLKKLLGKEHQIAPEYFKTFKLPSNTKIHFVGHHKSHAASAYYTSGNSQKTLVVTADGAGDDGNSLTVWLAEKGSMKLLKEYSTQYSFGYFYSAVTEALGWWVGDGEGTVMGLAPYGDPEAVPEKELSWLMPKFRDGKFVEPINFGKIHSLEYQETFHWHLRRRIN